MIDSIEQGRKEDGTRSIADKIIKRLHDLDKTVENNQGRWAWELLQNAKDSVAEYENRSVSIEIELRENTVEFRHNGMYFTEADIRGLINQISSKEAEEGEVPKKTGRFGTGFLTTHLLSKVINIKGILETNNKECFSFEFPLDRDGRKIKDLTLKIENSWSQFQKSTKKIDSEVNINNFNTSFSYSLTNQEQKSIAKIGIKEFTKLIPFVLAFIPTIDKVKIINRISNINIEFQREDGLKENAIVSIKKQEGSTLENILILKESNKNVSIACLLQQTPSGFSFQDIKDVPKLFCDFPLIGTESFHLPIIVNSFNFSPQTERDGIWLKGKKDKTDPEVEENQAILQQATRLFSRMLKRVSNENYFDFFNIADTRMPDTSEKYFDRNWFKEYIQKPMREAIFNTKMVELENPSHDRKTIESLWFAPRTYDESLKKEIWQYAYDFNNQAVCKKKHFQKWCNISWNSWKSLRHEILIKSIEGKKNLEDLSIQLNISQKECLKWLNSFYQFILKDETNLSLFQKSSMIPNQNGIFKEKSKLYTDEIKDSDLIKILQLLGEDWKDILLHENVLHGEYFSKTKEDIAKKITVRIKDETDEHDEERIQAISLLSEWFENNNKEGQEFFSELFHKRAKLFMDTILDKESLYKVMRSKTDLSKLSELVQTLDENPELIDKFNETSNLIDILSDLNVEDTSTLKSILKQAQGIVKSNKIDMTEEALANLGISNIEELEEALQDKDLAAMFTHTSTPNIDMFIHAQKLISRAKSNILKHLSTLKEYDCTDAEELATTILGGIKKDGIPIHIVTRPSDNGTVIVYYNSEKDTLDFENSELWVDDGFSEPKKLTLGRILKTTEINKIPV